MWTLKRYDKIPPGGFVFEQIQGIYRKWGFTTEWKKRAQEISDFRTANNLLRPSYEESLIDLIQYTCQRLGGMGCVDTDKARNAAPPPPKRVRGCAGCGARLK